MTKKVIMICAFTALFIFGIILILKSNAWGWGDLTSMNLAGAIISVFAGIGFLCELYGNKKH